MTPHALALAVSAVAVALSVSALTRSAPARLRDEADTALRIARDAIDRCDRIQGSWEVAKAEYGAILEAVNAERETIQRHRARLSAQASREAANQATAAPQSRDDLLAELRVQAGLGGNAAGG